MEELLLKQLEELNEKQAAQVFVKQRVRRYFEAVPEQGFEGGWFEGKICKVDQNLKHPETGAVHKGFLFLVHYEDDDQEHVDASTMISLLKDASAVHSKLKEVIQRRDIRGSNGPIAKRQRPLPAPVDENMDEEIENTAVIPRRDTAATKPQETRGRARPAGRSQSEQLRSRSDIGASEPGPSSMRVVTTSRALAIPWRPDRTRTVHLPGQVTCIELVNFMNFEHMMLEFAPHVTFLSGTNGSGKSATLQALQCALGVKAALTGRMAAQKDYVRTGMDEAIVRVTLANEPYEGRDAYKHEIYGNTITVERKISRGSSSHWALKNHHGRIVARRRDDLDAFLSHQGIDASNSAVVMTQDTCRSFMSGGSNKSGREKHDIFMKATQLDAVAEELTKSSDQISSLDETVKRGEDRYKVLQEHESEARHRREQLRELAGWREQIDRLERVLTWGVVHSQEQYVKAIEEQLDATPAEDEALEVEISNLEKEAEALANAVEQKQVFLKNFEENSNRIEQEQKEAKDVVKKFHRLVVQFRRKLQQLESDIAAGQAKKETLERVFTEATEAAEADMQAEQLEYVRKLDAANARQKELSEEAARRKQVLDQAESAEKEARERILELEETVRRAQAQVMRVQNELRSLSGNAKDAVSQFGGQAMVQFVAAIADGVRRGRFHRPPIGPIGQYLELSNTHWGRAVEASIGKAFANFIVHDRHDCQELQNLMRNLNFNYGQKPWICVAPLDLPQHAVPSDAQPRREVNTLLRVLSIKGDRSVAIPIFNYLVDHQNAERTALASDSSEGRQLIQERNVHVIFEVDGAKQYRRGQTETREEAPGWLGHRPVRLGLSTRDQHAAMTACLEKAKQEVLDAEAAVAAARRQLFAAEAAQKEARLAHRDAKKEENNCSTEMKVLQSQAPAATQYDPSQAEDALQEDIIAATQAVVDLESTMETFRKQLADAEANESEAQERFDGLAEERKQLQAENAESVANFEAEMRRQVSVDAELAKKRALIEERAAKRAGAQEALDSARQMAAQVREAALQVCSEKEAAIARIETEELLRAQQNKADKVDALLQPAFLEKKIARLEKKVADAEAQAGGTLAELELAHDKALRELEGEGAKLKDLIELHRNLKLGLRKRREKFNEVTNLVEGTVSDRFNRYMKRKGHLGYLKMDRANKTLSIAVQIGEKGAVGSDKITDLKQLSGGERSYTTVAFALALGAETEMPFRAMDEFDVYMDAVNRRVATDNLLQFAMEQRELQFIFLTPLDMGMVHAVREASAETGCFIPDDFIKIISMKPARNRDA